MGYKKPFYSLFICHFCPTRSRPGLVSVLGVCTCIHMYVRLRVFPCDLWRLETDTRGAVGATRGLRGMS